ncbi:hypothetical protein HK100_009878 [Physocladia obscura]|uniref:BZIP domain-containing protein n=1 Tax=Physocladia obscura TaxID=109957 RepID=A0AAD5SMR4_9FUNG|nr:hypothetical protein HK100_009878 [Physocladia obscura]
MPPKRMRGQNIEKPANAEDRRILQNRLAQRAFRQRKEQRIQELEAEIAALEQQLHQVQPESKELEPIESAAIMTENERLIALEKNVYVNLQNVAKAAFEFFAKFDNDNSQLSVNGSSTASMRRSNIIGVSSSSVDFVSLSRSALKLLPSLSVTPTAAKYITEVCDIRLNLSKCKDEAHTKRLLIAFIRAKSKVYEHCNNAVDRLKAIKIISQILPTSIEDCFSSSSSRDSVSASCFSANSSAAVSPTPLEKNPKASFCSTISEDLSNQQQFECFKKIIPQIDCFKDPEIEILVDNFLTNFQVLNKIKYMMINCV